MKEMRTVLNDGTVVFHFDDIIGNKVRKSRDYYEHGMLRYIKALSRTHSLKGTYVDAGANIGNHTLFFARYCASKVYAFEPVPANFSVLRKNMLENRGLAAKCEVYDKAISEDGGNYDFAPIPRNMGGIDLRPSKGGYLESINPDSIDFSGSVSLLKIDCESMSKEVLHAFRNVIAGHQPHIFIEAEPKEVGAMAADIGYEVVKQFNATPTFHIKPKQ